ncbi:lysoplasmalogenase [Falsiphaeobacter marinintestinus]|uniref:lysoplasmalogenase n=1 Tax=Falsiphaeobacter marinintestinus TaxID=1492905 RepID=UPI001FE90437|nr:lysoplasmalogenase [Phaeobacter marinintestinus]
MLQTVLPIAAGLCALAYLPLSPRTETLIRSAIKTASVALLALAAGLAQAPILLTLALALCALGDWLLSRPGDRAFMAGIGAFAAGHLAYVALFLTRPDMDPSHLSANPQLWIALALVVLGVIMASRIAPRAKDLRGAVLAYIPIILSMGFVALTLPLGTLVLPAALAFVASDTVLATEKFLLADDHPARRWTPYAVWPLYWLAQAGFWMAFS